MSVPVDVTTESGDIAFLNLVDPAFDFASPEVVRAQRENWYALGPTGPVVLRYPQAQELLRDRRLDHNGRGYLALNGIVDGPIYDWYASMIVNHDGVAHRRLRGLVNKAFTPRTVEAMRPFIRRTAEDLAARLENGTACDFATDFANQLPLAVMRELLGVPPEDSDHLRTWTTDIGLVFSLALGGDIPARVEAAVVGLDGYAEKLIRHKEESPADDLISALVAASRSEGRVTGEELRNLVVTLVFAAHDTTRHQLSNAMAAFADHPDQWELLASRPELGQQAVEEVMRYCPSAATIFRFAPEAFEYQGAHIAEGTWLTVCVLAAQRDPEVFVDGYTFDITVPRNTPPLQFGGGPHHCLGAALARVELAEALPALAARLGPPRLAGKVPWRPQVGIYGPYELPLAFGR